jgi:hypothetical protein
LKLWPRGQQGGGRRRAQRAHWEGPTVQKHEVRRPRGHHFLPITEPIDFFSNLFFPPARCSMRWWGRRSRSVSTRVTTFDRACNARLSMACRCVLSTGHRLAKERTFVPNFISFFFQVDGRSALSLDLLRAPPRVRNEFCASARREHALDSSFRSEGVYMYSSYFENSSS